VTPRVVIVDDHELFRAGVRAGLEGLVRIAGAAATVDEAVDLIAAEQPDVVLLDVHMPDGGGVAVLRRAAAAGTSARFLGALGLRRRRGRHRDDPRRRPRLRDEVDLPGGARRRDPAGPRRRRGLLAAAGRLRARRLRGRPSRPRPTPSSTS
jgi:hypothetical protein